MSSAGSLPDRASGEQSPVYKKKENKNKKSDTLGSPWCGRAALWACCGRAPPPMPMVSPERNDVRGELVLQSCEGWGRGRIATRAQNVPGGLVVGYSGRT